MYAMTHIAGAKGCCQRPRLLHTGPVRYCREMAGKLKIKAQVMAGSEIALGPGKAALLGEIDRLGSIAAAGRALGLSYRRTRDMVDTLNACWREPLVETSKGGSGGGGASLTPFGRQLVAAYGTLVSDLETAADRHAAKLLAILAEAQPAPE